MSRNRQTVNEKLRVGPVARHRRNGRLGARVFLERTENGWTCNYTLDTHGLNEEQVAEAIEEKREHHRQKAARIDGFVAGVIDHEFQVGTETWRVLDCMLLEVGNGVELFVQAAPVSGPKFDKRRIVRTKGQYRSIDNVPDDAAILRAITAAVGGKSSDEERHRAFSERVMALAGVE